MLNKYLFFAIVGIYIILCGFIYFLIFRKHHKRNEVKLDELVGLVTKFYSLTTISVLMIGFGFYLFANAATYRYDREEVIKSILIGIFIITAVVINYINYLKNSLKDFDKAVREENRKRNMHIGEILELIIFTFFIFMPVFKIPVFIKLKDFKNELYMEIAKSVMISCSSMFLIYNLNPLEIKEKIFKNKND